MTLPEQHAARFNLRKITAFVVASLMTRKIYLTVECPNDPPGTRAAIFVGEVNNDIHVLDVVRDTHVSGRYSNGQLHLHDKQTGIEVKLTITGNTFLGRTSSGSDFHGSVERDRVYLFDDTLRERQHYSLHLERATVRGPGVRPPLALERAQQNAAD